MKNTISMQMNPMNVESTYVIDTVGCDADEKKKMRYREEI